MTTLKQIKEKAINIVPGYQINNGLGGVETVSAEVLERVIKNCEGNYGSNNGSVAFVSEGQYYVLPFTLEMLDVLEEAGFKDRSIMVMISGWQRPDNPEDAKRWERLKEEQVAG